LRITLTIFSEWQWDQLRIMKVGGNESATKYFQSHGGTAALASNDPKTKYTSNAANKYKDELKRRANADAIEYPEEVVVTDISTPLPGDGTATPAGEPSDDFFSSWDKPSIKRPSNPPSRTATPPVISRTASPFLSANTNGNNTTRPKSPLVASEAPETTAPALTATRTTSSTAIRKGPTAGGPRKTNVLGAKKQKLGAKRISSGADAIDFDAAEKKAKEEAERIAKLGYDPNAEEAEVATKTKATAPSIETKIAAPTPLNPGKQAFGATKGHERSPSEMERLGMGMGRLGFGQIGGGKPAGGAAPPKKMGFGSIGASKPIEGKSLAAHGSIIP
jgi:ADP-ribosylation factor GTPase-activating protein 2/3